MTAPGTAALPTFLDLLKGDAPLGLIWLALGSPALAEVAMQARPAAMVLDKQHGLWGRNSLETAIGVLRQQVPVIVRCAENAPLAVSEALDAGASSVLVPLIESGEEAARAIAHGRYPPLGNRSAGGIRPLLRGIDRMRDANTEVAMGVMIETVAGVENADEIASVPGLDYLFIGTGDLAFSRGTGDMEQLAADCRRVQAAAAKYNVPCGIFTGNAQDALRQTANGYRVTVIANDIELARSGFCTAAEQFAGGLKASV